METLIIEIQDPRARKLIDDLVDLGIIAIKTSQSSWQERWDKLSNSLPDINAISEQEILEEISDARQNRQKS